MSGRPTLFTLANIYTSVLHALDGRNTTAAWMYMEHAKTVDRRRHDSYGIPYALDWSEP